MASPLFRGKILQPPTPHPELRRRLAIAAIFLTVVAFSALTGLLLAQQNGLLLTGLMYAAILGLVGFFLLSENLGLGVLGILLTAGFSPLTIPTGTASRIPDSMVVTILVAVVWVARMLVVNKRFALVRSPTNVPILAWCAVVVISLFWSMSFRDPQVIIWDSFPFVQMASAVLMVALPAAYLLVANQVRKEWQLQIMALLMVVLGIISVVLYFLHSQIHFFNRLGLTYMWAAGISLALGLFDKRLWLWVRALLIGHAAAWVVWGFFMNISWVAGWLPGLFCMGLLVLMRSRKLVLLAIPIVVVAVLMNLSYFQDRFTDENNESGITRLAAWRVNWRVTGEHVLFGTGPGGYAAYYMTYFPHEAMATHNNYLDILAQTGAIGLGVILWLFASIFWQGFLLYRRLRGRGDFLEAMANVGLAGAAACALIMAFGDWLLPFAYTQTIAGFDYAVFNWIFMGTIVAIDNMVPPQPEAAHV